MIKAVISIALAAIILGGRAQAADVSEPAGYRLENYRAATPTTLRGGQVVTTQEAEMIWRSGSASFVDVLPRPPRPKTLPEGTIWHDKPRLDIPGSIWLPDTGYGQLAPSMADYFASGLRKVSRGDKTRLLVLYCLEDCWMSWNAAKRALALGYTHIAWYRDGTDGWSTAGLPLESATPEPRPDE
jgi:PQQ-dependent catabolism-associated CXXCW motif protein